MDNKDESVQGYINAMGEVMKAFDFPKLEEDDMPHKGNDKIMDNPQAFPSEQTEFMAKGIIAHKGMELRDYFAGQAVHRLTIMDDLDFDYEQSCYNILAKTSYKIADAMIKERSKSVK